MPIRICFVCLGNICRSPTAEAAMRLLVHASDLAAEIEMDSAGTGAWHVGEPPDRRARAAAKRRGLELRGRARKVVLEDFERFEYVIAMDRSNLRDLHQLAPNDAAKRKVELLRNYDPEAPGDAEVPDPYYGGGDGFERVIDICEAACRGLLEHIRAHHGI
jgi:protein-tyrosine phosphatase